ncbi:MAG: undecaprenyl diphosphate synthase [Rickettsiaceae bacterium]|jgi:undecaprenyl diphosphate synthase|nr:undecaprenyl diphosphate synthase [Rickettsiaceae bacterium]
MVSNSLTIPTHIAVIMDGNARWAKSKNLPTAAGHKAGSQAIKTLVKSAIEFGVKYLTIYAFSTENWQRPKDEVSYLMLLLKEYLTKEIDELVKNDVKIVVSGNLQNVEKSIVEKIKKIEEQTKDNKAICLNVAFDYGSRQEIVDGLKRIIVDIQKGKVSFDQIDQSLVSQNLYQPQIPDPDILIRTAGELRLSNFLLWQLAYTELYFTEKFWPDFSKQDLENAILDFNQRKRNYGKRLEK